MKNIFLSAILSGLTIFSFATRPNIDNISVNRQSSIIKWIGSKISESHEGTINISKGKLSIENGILVGGQFVIDMNTIKTTDMSEKYNKKLDKHLKNEDFFNVSDFPFAFIKIINAKKAKKGNMYIIVADLTIKGITHDIEFEADVDIDGLNYQATANIVIDRTKWDIRYNSGKFFKDLGDKLILDKIKFDVSLISSE